MRLLRLSLLSSYLVYLNKNKRTALRFINLGIFLCIFAISTAAISFFIEREISKKQTELLYYQVDNKYFSNFIGELQTAINTFETLLRIEDRYSVEKEYQAQSDVESQFLTGEDFYSPYIFSNLLSSREYFDDFKSLMDPNTELFKQIIFELEENWAKEDIDKFKKLSNKAYKSLLEINKIDINLYKSNKVQSLEEIVLEILNYKNNNVYNYNNKIYDDYLKVKNDNLASINYFDQLLLYFSGVKESIQLEVKKLNSDIILLSRKEKNYILGTFLIQLVIFIIIQFFEINSINFNLLKISRKNEKKIK